MTEFFVRYKINYILNLAENFDLQFFLFIIGYFDFFNDLKSLKFCHADKFSENF